MLAIAAGIMKMGAVLQSVCERTQHSRSVACHVFHCILLYTVNLYTVVLLSLLKISSVTFKIRVFARCFAIS